jgi:hypothetical protein
MAASRVVARDVLSFGLASTPVDTHSAIEDHGRRPMTHARSLRVIGQKLEITKLPHFQLEHDGENYTLTSDLMSRTAEWILRYATTQETVPSRRPKTNTVLLLPPITFNEADLIRLDGWEAKRRREPLPVQPATKLSQLLRIMGAHLDKNAARTFAIFWTATSVVVDYRRAGGYADRLRLSPEKIADTIGGSFHRVLTALPKR